MRHWVIAGALLAGLFNCGLALPAEAAPPGKPLFAGMKNENDSDVQHVRDALTGFNGANKRWPANLDELSAFAQQYRLPLDLTVFDRANYSVQNQGGASVAVFEFVMKGSPTKGAFAIANYSVKK
ncbi:hypothetical protein [Dongia sp.]|uniref:hypothetical protein n=1 Tax=Dongia sp. TaxID=1977262 RepID=UPI003750107A